MTNRMKAILGASATIAVWATAFPFGKVALQSVDALTLSVARVVGGAILMLIIGVDRKSTRLNSSHSGESRMPSSA